MVRSTTPSVHLVVGSAQVNPATSVRDLGVYLDSDLSMKSHITRLVCSCFGVLRQIHSIRPVSYTHLTLPTILRV